MPIYPQLRPSLHFKPTALGIICSEPQAAVLINSIITMSHRLYYHSIAYTQALVCTTVVERGQVNVILASPEALKTGRWLPAMKRYQQRICLLAYDEMHCLSEWYAEIVLTSLSFNQI